MQHDNFFNTLKNHIKEFQAPELDTIFDEQVKGNVTSLVKLSQKHLKRKKDKNI